ncbi:MAG TPA: DUF192 domain-containing protein [Candidatus Cloacimonadota bacterium]|nr:DUF192 domain-containing protein [Candidatus Cloacimonadota bacterium]
MRSLLLLLLTLFYLSACKPTPDNQSTNQTDTFIKQGEVIIINDMGDSIYFETEIADSPEKTEKGLMYRKEMKDNQGMFFIFDYDKPLSFWMKNTYIPLDIIFIDSNLQIVSISENCMPLSEDMIPSLKPAKYVLEVNAGLTRKLSIKIQNKVIFRDLR